jgi:hypothetical protein
MAHHNDMCFPDSAHRAVPRVSRGPLGERCYRELHHRRTPALHADSRVPDGRTRVRGAGEGRLRRIGSIYHYCGRLIPGSIPIEISFQSGIPVRIHVVEFWSAEDTKKNRTNSSVRKRKLKRKIGSVENLVLLRQGTLCGSYEGDPLSPERGEAAQGGEPP